MFSLRVVGSKGGVTVHALLSSLVTAILRPPPPQTFSQAYSLMATSGAKGTTCLRKRAVLPVPITPAGLLQASDFIVWSCKEEAEVMRVRCGGWRRPWALHHVRCHTGASHSLTFVTSSKVPSPSSAPSPCHLRSKLCADDCRLRQGGQQERKGKVLGGWAPLDLKDLFALMPIRAGWQAARADGRNEQ